MYLFYGIFTHDIRTRTMRLVLFFRYILSFYIVLVLDDVLHQLTFCTCHCRWLDERQRYGGNDLVAYVHTNKIY